MTRKLKAIITIGLSISWLALGLSAATVNAAGVQFAALIAPRADVTLAFEDGSERLFRLVQREGKTRGGPLDGTTMREWGTHELTPDEAQGRGYLVFTHASGDIAYLRFQWVARGIPNSGGDISPRLAGSWDVAGGTGRFSSLTGVGTVRIDMPSTSERYWVFEGDMNISQALSDIQSNQE
jgi:hypothetical protein